MGFQVKKQTHVVWPVKVNVPTNGGKADSHEFYVKFERLSETRFNELAALGQTKLLTEVVCEVGETEADLAKLNEASRAELLGETNYRVGLYESYLRMDAGVAVKN